MTVPIHFSRRSFSFFVLAAAASIIGVPGSFIEAVAAQPASAQAVLKIVVLEGEDAVNIIQQKTAVAPVVEVRDRNDQPVAGVVVRFAIRSGRATFAGARNLTVTTNAAGRAVATGFTPTGSGAVQIGASATFQGQTAVATIAQTNVMTAAEAAAASGSGASGGSGGASGGAGTSAGGGAAGGAGGGLSATTVGIIGGAVGAGALAATKVMGGSADDGGPDDIGPGGTTYTGQYTGNLNWIFGPSCTRTHSVSGTMTMQLTINTGGTGGGTASMSQAEVVVVHACPGGIGPQLGDRDQVSMERIQVQATGGRLTFQVRREGTPGTRTEELTFSGDLNGGQITGTMSENVAVAPGATIVGTGAYPIMLTVR